MAETRGFEPLDPLRGLHLSRVVRAHSLSSSTTRLLDIRTTKDLDVPAIPDISGANSACTRGSRKLVRIVLLGTLGTHFGHPSSGSAPQSGGGVPVITVAAPDGSGPGFQRTCFWNSGRAWSLTGIRGYAARAIRVDVKRVDLSQMDVERSDSDRLVEMIPSSAVLSDQPHLPCTVMIWYALP